MPVKQAYEWVAKLGPGHDLGWNNLGARFEQANDGSSGTEPKKALWQKPGG